MDFRERHVVVTGGTGALGTAVVAALLARGAICHVPYRDDKHRDRTPHRDRVTMIAVADLADEEAVASLYATIPKLWASIHVAGGFAMSKIADTTKADIQGQFDVNVLTAFLCSREAVKAMTRTGDGGRIVNVAAKAALEPRSGAGMVAYATSKAAVAAMTAALAEEVVKSGILVNAVAPSIIDTPQNRADMPKADFSHWPKVEEVTATILHLASPDNKVTRGAIVPVYGKS